MLLFFFCLVVVVVVIGDVLDVNIVVLVTLNEVVVVFCKVIIA